MAEDVKLYAFVGGHIKQPKEMMFKGCTDGGFVYHPIPFFVVKHGKSYTAIDTGMHRKVAVDYASYWGEFLSGVFTPTMSLEDVFSTQVKAKLGLEPRHFESVILTHGHLDHSGDIETFKDTGVPIYVQKSEYEIIKQARSPEGVMGYIAEEFQYLDHLNFKPFNGVLDLFNDGTVVAFPMPGHTMGMMSVLVKTNKKTFIIASDAVNTIDQLDRVLEPYVCADVSHSIQGLHVLGVMRLMGAEVIPMHDHSYWENKPLAPEPFEF